MITVPYPYVRPRGRATCRVEVPVGWPQLRSRRKLRRRETGWGVTGGELSVRRITNLFRRRKAASLHPHGEAWNQRSTLSWRTKRCGGLQRV